MIYGAATQEHNFEKVLAWLMQYHSHEVHFDQNQTSNVTVQHDAWCGLWQGMRCDCQPDLIVGTNPFVYPKEILQNGQG